MSNWECISPSIPFGKLIIIKSLLQKENLFPLSISKVKLFTALPNSSTFYYSDIEGLLCLGIDIRYSAFKLIMYDITEFIIQLEVELTEEFIHNYFFLKSDFHCLQVSNGFFGFLFDESVDYCLSLFMMINDLNKCTLKEELITYTEAQNAKIKAKAKDTKLFIHQIKKDLLSELNSSNNNVRSKCSCVNRRSVKLDANAVDEFDKWFDYDKRNKLFMFLGQNEQAHSLFEEFGINENDVNVEEGVGGDYCIGNGMHYVNVLVKHFINDIRMEPVIMEMKVQNMKGKKLMEKEKGNKKNKKGEGINAQKGNNDKCIVNKNKKKDNVDEDECYVERKLVPIRVINEDRKVKQNDTNNKDIENVKKDNYHQQRQEQQEQAESFGRDRNRNVVVNMKVKDKQHKIKEINSNPKHHQHLQQMPKSTSSNETQHQHNPQININSNTNQYQYCHQYSMETLIQHTDNTKPKPPLEQQQHNQNPTLKYPPEETRPLLKQPTHPYKQPQMMMLIPPPNINSLKKNTFDFSKFDNQEKKLDKKDTNTNNNIFNRFEKKFDVTTFETKQQSSTKKKEETNDLRKLLKPIPTNNETKINSP